MSKVLNETGLSYLWSKIKARLDGKSDTGHGHNNASESAAGFMSAADKKKLNLIASGANSYEHPTDPGFKHIPAGGSSGQILRWESNGTAVWGADNNTTYSNATTSAAGLMSAADKSKLEGIASEANAYTHPDSHPASMITGLSTVATSGSYDDLSNKPTIPAAYTHPTSHPASMITGLSTVATSGSYNDLSNKPTIPAAYSHPTTSGNKHIPAGGSSGQILRWSADGTAAWGADNNTTYSNATTSAAGLMSAADKSKLEGIASEANAYTLPTASSTTLGGVKIGSNISISSGTISVPAATGTSAGVTIVYPAASCTTFTSDSGTCTPAAVKKAVGMFDPKAHTHTASDVTGLATVATSGSYNDLADRPTIPAGVTVDTALSSTSTNPVQNKVVNSALAGKVPTTRTVNGKALSANITLTMSDVTGNIDCGTF